MIERPNRRVRPAKTGIAAPLGDLELQVMKFLWSCGPEGCQSADVQHALQQSNRIALTTTLTTLERLASKGIISREREQKLYRYRALFSEEQLQQRIVEGIMGDLIQRFPRAVAAYLAGGNLRSEETSSLEKMAGLLEQRRSRRTRTAPKDGSGEDTELAD